jgi:hypothetical protein
MKIQYNDEYGEVIYIATVENIVPRVGEAIIYKDEDYRVRNVTWLIEEDLVVVEITQNLVRSVQEDKTEGRLKETKSAIVSLTERVESAERRGRILADQVVRIKTHIRTQERKNK